MPVEFPCEHCGRRLRVASRKAGATVRCPKCHQPTVVPAASAAPAEPVIAPPGELPAPPASAPPAPLPPPAGHVLPPIQAERPLAAEAGKAPIDFGKVLVPRRIIYAQGALLAIVAIVSFALGWLAGGLGGSTAEALPEGPFAVTGRVVYDPGNHQATPDAGAVVVLLPQEVRPLEKVSHLGLRPEEPSPGDAHPALLAIREWGGDYARANAQGEFHLEAPQAGKYFVLWLSANAPRSGEAPLDRRHLAQIGRYFQTADALIAPTLHDWSEVSVRQDRRLRHVFQ